MTRRNKLIVLISYLLLLILFMLVYRVNRAKKVKALRAEIAKVSAEQSRVKAAESEAARLTRTIPTEGDSPAFIESLYRAAQETGLKQHEISTEADRNPGAVRPGATDTAGGITKQKLKISANGTYRSFAEYVRRIQNSERLVRITDFKLLPDTARLKGTLTVELYSLQAKK